MIGPDVARETRTGEEDEVDALVRAAFPGPEEAELVRALRAHGDMVREMVLPWEDRIGAYAGISRMVAPKNWFCLAPVAVWPDLQNSMLRRLHGEQTPYQFGSRLVGMIATAQSMSVMRAGLAKLGWLDGNEPVTLVVLGKPSFYARAGFSLERAAALTSPYPVKNTLIHRPGYDVPEVELVYPQAFQGLE